MSDDGLPALAAAERRRVSVLFVDLADFTALAESMDAEDVRRIQSRYFEVARSVVARYGGTIEKFIGDAVMAVWGAPSAHEDDAERAVRAALALVYAVDRIGGAASRVSLRARAAVTTGEAAVTLGALGQGMVSGDLVNVAARLQTRAPVGGVLVDATTRKRAPEAATFERGASLTLKGRAGRLTAYRAVGRTPEPVSRHAGAHTGPFVGRDREMRELTDLLGSVIRDGRSRLVSVTGIAGIGKSRLSWELANWVDSIEDAVAWHEGRSPPYGEGIAFAPVAQMVRRRIRVNEGVPPELARRQLASALEEFVADEAERRWIEPRLGTLLARDGIAAFDRDELFAAWRRFFERVSEQMPVVLVFEDLQWADPSLIAFIEHLATWSRKHPMMIVTLARPEFTDGHPSWGAGPGSFTSIRLERLTDDAMLELLAQRGARLPPHALRQVLERAGGVPLYAVELARMLQQSSQAAPARRVPAAQPGPALIDVPDSLHGLISARIDGLPAAERQLLLAAAALGQRFRPEALVAVAGGDAAAARGRIDSLIRRELLTLDEELDSPGRGELSFLQDLVRDVAYRTLGRGERRALHMAAARYLESLGDDVAEPLAGHLVEAHRLTTEPREAVRLARRAVAALRHAARDAATLHVPDRALGLLERALALDEGGEQRIAILEETADAARAAGRLDVAEQHLREVVRIHAAARQTRAAARTRARLASVLLSAQRNEPALAELETAMRGARGWDRDAFGVEVAAQLARARLLSGNDREALSWAERALVAARRLGLTVIGIDLLATRGTARLSTGEEEGGLTDLRDAIAQAQDAGSLHTELRARNNLAWALLGDDPRAAMETAREGFDLASSMGLADAAVPLADIACTAAVETGDWAWALATIDELEERGVTDAYRIVLAATAAIIRTLRGDPAPLAAVDGLEPLAPDTDAQVVAAVQHARSWAAFVRGAFEEARRLAEASIAGYVGNDPAYQQAMATRASLWLGDRKAAAVSLDRLDAATRRGRAAVATSMTMRAGVEALDGDPAAAAGYRRACEQWSVLGLPLQLVLCLLDRHRLLVDDASDVLTAIDQLGAEGLHPLVGSDHREPISSPGAPRRPARSRQPSAGTGSRTGEGRHRRPAPDRPAHPG